MSLPFPFAFGLFKPSQQQDDHHEQSEPDVEEPHIDEPHIDEEASIEGPSVDETPVDEVSIDGASIDGASVEPSQPDLSDVVYEPSADEVNAIAGYFDNANAVEVTDPDPAVEATSEVCEWFLK